MNKAGASGGSDICTCTRCGKLFPYAGIGLKIVKN